MQGLLAPFEGPIDVVGFVLWLLVFPVYHSLYPLLAHRRTALERFGRFRRSWVKRVIDNDNLLFAVQATRNLTMVNTLLASSALIMMGFTINLIPDPSAAGLANRAGYVVKLELILIVLAMAFSFLLTALRHLGQFALTVGADPADLGDETGSAVDYLTGILGKASSGHTLGVRAIYGTLPLFLWLIAPWLFLALVAIWALKFVRFDFLPGRSGSRRTPE